MPRKYDPELRQRALRMLAEARPEHESLTAETKLDLSNTGDALARETWQSH